MNNTLDTAALELLQEQNQLLREQNDLLREQLEIERQKMHTLLGRREYTDEIVGLTPEQEAVFEQLEMIPGNDEAALILAQAELAKLEGQRVTKALCTRLQRFLRSRQWGVQSANGIVTMPGWLSDAGRPEGGYIRLCFTNPATQKSATAQSISYLPALVLIDRPDQRRIRNQTDQQKIQNLLGQRGTIDEIVEFTPEQEAVFQRLEAIPGNDEAARKLAESELAHFVGHRATKPIVKRLQGFLKSREIGIETDGGQAAAPVWQPDRGRPDGGYMRLTYFDSNAGRSVQIGSYSKLPTIHLLLRPDRRRTRHE